MGEGSWRERAACRGMDTNVFFPEHAHAGTAAQIERVCGYCPVRRECLAAEVEYDVEFAPRALFGWYGGIGPRERAGLVKAARERRDRGVAA
jgi:WhiB family transcriptional regulator, redox-sensing transcriptional regulator